MPSKWRCTGKVNAETVILLSVIIHAFLLTMLSRGPLKKLFKHVRADLHAQELVTKSVAQPIRRASLIMENNAHGDDTVIEL